MSYKASIAWQQGQFLQPQHFQLADLNVQAQLAAAIALVQPNFWGFSQLTLDLAALEQGQLIVNSGQLFWQDGSYLQLTDNAAVMPRLIPVDFLKEGNPLDVYIGLKRLDSSKANATLLVDQNRESVDSRYVIEPIPLVQADLYQPGPDANVSQLSYVLKLFFKDEIQAVQAYDLWPLVRIAQQKNTFVVHNTVFPPVVQLGAYAPLWAKLQDNTQRWTEAYQFALAHKPNLDWYQVRLGGTEISHYALTQTLYRLLPPLLDLVNQASTHPFCLYQSLQQAIHELSFFMSAKTLASDADSANGSALPYEHQKSYLSLLASQQRLNQLLEKILTGPQYSVSLKRVGNHYEAQLPEQFLTGNDHFYLIIQGAGTAVQCFMEHIISSGKLTSAQAIDDYIQHAIPGVPLNYLSSRPTGAPDIAGALYFQIDCKHPEWSPIIQKATVGFYPGNIQEALTVEMVAAQGS